MQVNTKISALAIYCGSSKGKYPVYQEAAQNVGKILANKDIALIYGAGNVGLMGIVADAVLAHQGTAIGVIPEFLKDWEVYHHGLTELVVTETMHQRKQIMANRADAFVMLPGGYGTLDEFFEIATWKQLHLHQKPIGILNTNGYYDHILQHIEMMVREGFLKDTNLDLISIDADFDQLLKKMEQQESAQVGKWVDKDQ